MKVTPNHIAFRMLVVAFFFTYLLSVANAESKIDNSLYALKNEASLSVLESRRASVAYIDTRDKESCQRMSIKGGLCISPDELRYPDGTLASFRDINWLIGTYGVSTENTIVVLGDNKTDVYMVAAVLYLLGVTEVAVWDSNFASIAAVRETGNGRVRGILRSEYFSNPMRDELIALDSDLKQLFKRATNVTVEKLDSTGFDGQLIRAPSELPIVTGSTPSAALANFTDQVLSTKIGASRVHTIGLSGRSFSDFGYIRTNHSLTIAIAAVLILSISIVGVRRKLS